MEVLYTMVIQHSCAKCLKTKFKRRKKDVCFQLEMARNGMKNSLSIEMNGWMHKVINVLRIRYTRARLSITNLRVCVSIWPTNKFDSKNVWHRKRPERVCYERKSS